MSYAALGCQWLLVAVFGAAAAGKLTSRQAYAEFVVSTGRLLPTRWSRWRRPAAVGVLVGELVTAMLLVVPATATLGFTAAAGLGLLFGAGVAAALRRGERAPCRCFGISTTPLGRPHLVRNALVAGVAVGGLTSTLLAPAGPVHPAGALVAVAAGLVTAVLVVRLDDVVALFAPTPQGR